MPRRPATERAVQANTEHTRDALFGAVEESDGEVDALLDVVVEYADRVQAAAKTLQAAIRRGNLEHAARAGAQVAALARMAECRMLVAAERRRAVLTMTATVLEALPDGPGARRLARQAQADRRRVARRV